jgi:hypothetical protein
MFHGWTAIGLPLEARKRGRPAGQEQDPTLAASPQAFDRTAHAASTPLPSQTPRKLSNNVSRNRKKSKSNKRQNRSRQNNHVLIVSE